MPCGFHSSFQLNFLSECKRISLATPTQPWSAYVASTRWPRKKNEQNLVLIKNWTRACSVASDVSILGVTPFLLLPCLSLYRHFTIQSHYGANMSRFFFCQSFSTSRIVTLSGGWDWALSTSLSCTILEVFSYGCNVLICVAKLHSRFSQTVEAQDPYEFIWYVPCASIGRNLTP